MASLAASIGKHLPNTWESRYSLEVHRFELAAHCSEYGNVKTKFCATFPSVTPDRIQRVESAHLYGMYLLKKAEYGEDVDEKTLWHATSEANCANIVETNLDWRRASRVKFGRGVSFSPSAEYANRECNRNTPTARVSIQCKVLVKKKTPGDSYSSLPAGDADTTTGNGGQVYVKYADNEFYPEYVVYYDSPPRVYYRRFHLR